MSKMERFFAHEEDEGPKPDRPGDAANFWSARLNTPAGENPAALNLKIKRDLEIRRAKTPDAPPSAFRFEDFGPGNFGGRVRAIVVHPNNPDLLLTGSVSGGVWKSSDGGQSWQAQGDFMANLAIGCMIGDPDQSDVVYAGTGEGFFNGDQMRGLGIFKSVDFGETWTQLPVTANTDFYYVNRLGRIPNSNVLLAATRTGIFRSEDLGQTFENVSGIVTTGRGFVDLKVDPSDPNRIYAYHYGLGGADTPANTVAVEAPEDLVGEYPASGAQFGPQLLDVGPISGQVVLFLDSEGGGSLACSAPADPAALNGRIALIDRGECAFVDKVTRAQQAGAIAVIMVNNVPGSPIVMGGDGPGVTIPSIMVDQFTGTLFRDFVDQGLRVTLTSTLRNERFLTVSRDGGQSFEVLTSANGLPVTNISRMEIGIGSDGWVYVSVADASENPATRGLWRSRDGGRNFVKTPSNANFIERQGWYDLMVGVDPSDSNRVYLGAIDVFRTIDGGVTINQISRWAPNPGQIPIYVHADVHAIAFHPNDPQTIWIGTDGGIFKSTDGGSTFTSLNRDLRIAQNYGIAVHPNGQEVITGTQDNGSHIFFGDKKIWLEWAGGDGGFCAWDQQNPDYVYGSNPYGDLFGSPDAGSVLSYFDLPDTTGAQFIQPFALDPQNGNRMIVGTDNIFFTHNARNLAMADWIAATPALGGSVSALLISPHDGDVAYAGTTQGRVFRVTGLGTTNDVHRFNNLPTGSIVTWIEIDPHDASGRTFYVTFSDYGADRVFKTTDGGETFTSIHGNLPYIPVHSVTVDPRNADRVFVGTELGLWVSENNQSQGAYSWSQYDYGTAWTRVVQMVWGDDDTLWVGTHGRGMFRMTRDPIKLETELVELQGDGDAFIDLYERHQLVAQVRNATGQTLESVDIRLNSEYRPLEIHDAPQSRPTLGPFETWTVPFELLLDELEGPISAAFLTCSVTWSGGHQTFDVPLILGAQENTQTGTFVEDAEDAMTWMNHYAILHEDDWQRVTTQAHSGSRAWFAADIDGFADKSLETPWLTVNSPDADLSFWIFYDMEGDVQQYWDGAVLEAMVEGEDWQDVGQRIRDVPYDGQLFSNTSLQFRDAWSGRQRTWRQANLDLGAFSGKTMKLRIRVGCDQAAAVPGGGVWIDDISISGVSWKEAPTADAAPCTQCSRIKGTELPFDTYLAHTPSDGDLNTWIGVINPSSEPVQVEVFGFSAQGNVLGVFETALEGHGMLWQATRDWFPQTATDITWLQVAAEWEVMVFADMKAPDVGSAYAASMGLTDQITLPHVAKNTGLFETYLASQNSIR